MGRKKPVKRRKKTADDLEVSPRFFERPAPAAVEPSPPDIPEKLIPVLRKKPIVIGPRRPRRGKPVPEPRAPRLATSPIAAALRRRAAERPGDAPKKVDAEVEVPAEPAPVKELAALQRAATVSVESAANKGLRPPEPLRARGLGHIGLFGSFLVLVAVLGVVGDASLPWLYVDADRSVGPNVAPNLESGTLGRSDLAQERAVNPYFDRLVGWPMLACLFLVFTGLLLAGIDELPRVTIRAHRIMQAVLLAIASFLGFVIGLTGTRWIGLYVNALLDEGGSSVHLHVAPYLNLLIGVGVFGVSAWLLLRRWSAMRREHSRGYFAIEDVEAPKNFLLACAALLLVVPLLPLATIETDDGRAFVGEAELAAARNDADTPLRPQIGSYGMARAMVWLSLYTSVFALGAGLVHRATGRAGALGTLVLSLGFLAVPVFVGGVATLVFHGQLIVGPPSPSLNWFLAVGYALLGRLYYQYVRGILAPYVAQADRGRLEAGP